MSIAPVRRRRSAATLPALFAILAAAGAGQSREPTHRLVTGLSPATSGGFGTSCAALGDIDGDGYADYAVGAPDWPYGAYVGRVFVYSGRTSAVLLTLDGDQASSNFGEAIADAGDVTGDGVRDIAVAARNWDVPGAPNAGRIYMFSGAGGSLVWTRDGDFTGGAMGTTLGNVGDLTGDGRADLIAGEPGYSLGGSGLGRMRFINGSSGVFIGEAVGTVQFQSLGTSLAIPAGGGASYVGTGAGRVYLVGTPVLGVGAVTLLLLAPGGAQATPQLDIAYGPLGMPYLVVGRQYGDAGGFTNCGTVDVFPVGTTTPLFTIAGAANSESVGARIMAVRDMNGDGEDEIGWSSSTTVFFENRIRIRTFSGVLLEDFTRSGSPNSALDSIPDVTGDGRGEWLNAIANGVSGTFECDLYSSGLAVTTTTSSPSGFTADFAVDAGPLRAGLPYAQLWGFSGASPGTFGPAPWPLVPLNIDAVTLYILSIAGGPMFPNALGLLGGAGTAVTNVLLPPPIATAVSGLTATTAVVVTDAGGASVVFAGNPVVLTFP